MIRIAAGLPQWFLVNIYIDIATSKTGFSNKAFNCMMETCCFNKLVIILTKNFSRLGWDTVEILDALDQLRVFDIRVIF